MAVLAAMASLPAAPFPNAAAVVITGINPTATIDLSDIGLAALQPHGTYSGSATLSGGEVQGADMPVAAFRTSITKRDIALWNYRKNDGNLNPQSSYTIVNAKATSQAIPNSTVTISSVTPSATPVRYDPLANLYTGYADITFDIFNARASGNHTTNGSTVTITVTNL